MLAGYASKFPSQKKAASSLRNVSESTVIQIRKGNWEGISDDMWRVVGKQVGYSNKGQWKFVPAVTNCAAVARLCEDAKRFGNVYCITAPPGSGKTAAAKWYEGQNDNVAHVECAEFMKKRDFLQLILQKFGKENAGGSVPEMMSELIDMLLKMEEPLIIMDEVDKLTDSLLFFFITIYNQLHGKCGIVMLSTDYMAKRIEKGRRMNKRGYAEIFSRLGRRFIELPGLKKSEVEQVCRHNGVEDEAKLNYIYNECECDMRRVERLVHKIKVTDYGTAPTNRLKTA